MVRIPLDEFISANRSELVRRCRAKVAKRSDLPPTETEKDHGVPRFIDQLVDELRTGPSKSNEIGTSATRHGHDLLLHGFTVGEVVHDYGDLCQSVTELATELDAPISTSDFRTLNRCLDDAIAGAVTEYGRRQDVSDDGSRNELRNLCDTAISAFEAVQGGRVGVGGSTGEVVHSCLLAIRSFSERAAIPR